MVEPGTLYIDEAELELWLNRGSAQKNDACRQLAERYLPFCRSCAQALYRQQQRRTIELEEYVQYGVSGLLEAIERFDVDRNVPFEVYARFRIEGAIRNGIAHHSEQHERIVAIREHREEWTAAVESRISAERTDDFETLVDFTVNFALGFVLREESGAFERSQSVGDDPYAGTSFLELRRKLLVCIEDLPDDESRVITMHYFQHKKFVEIARSMELTKGRISQIHQSGLAHLRKTLREQGQFSASY